MALPELKTLLQELVRIPSVTCGERGVDESPFFGEARLANYVADFLRSIGLAPQIEDVHRKRPAVWARLDAGRAKTILLQAHLDTVEPEVDDPNPFSGEERDGCVYGRGSCDCKASMAVFLKAMEAVARDPSRLRYNVIVAGVPDEEHALTGSLWLAQRLKGQMDFAICGEPTSLVPVTTHKGVLRWKVTVMGIPAHSACPELGVNAIHRAAPLIQAIEGYCERLSASDTDLDLKHPTACLVGIHGGTAVNVVPGECELLVDRRMMPDEDEEGAEAEFIAALSGAAAREHWRLERIRTHCQPLKRCGENEFLDGLLAALQSAGLPARAGAIHCGTDAPNYVAHGCPAIVWGPGELSLAHTRNECVSLKEVESAFQVLLRFLCA